jgi:hypothetical protein
VLEGQAALSPEDVEASLADATARADDLRGEIILLSSSAREARDWRSREQVRLVLPHLIGAAFVCWVFHQHCICSSFHFISAAFVRFINVEASLADATARADDLRGTMILLLV